MTSRLGALTASVILLASLLVACGGDEEPRSPTPSPTTTPIIIGDLPSPPATEPATRTASPEASATMTRSASPSSTLEPTPTSMPNVPVGETGNAEIYVMNADGSEQRRLTDAPTMEVDPAWSPDGSMLAFSSYESYQAGGLYVMNADGSNVRRLTDHPVSGPRWSPDGSQIMFTWNEDNTQYEEIYMIGADGSGATRLTSFENVPTASLSTGNTSPAWSPDGTRIVFIATQLDGPSEVHVMNADGTNVLRLTDSPTRKANPVWSPDGTQIAFWTDEGGADVWVMQADGTDQRSLTSSEAIDILPAWSPDGQTIAFIRQTETGANQIVLINADGSDSRVIADRLSNVELLIWSPDGAKIAYTTFREQGSTGIFVVNADGSDVRQLTDASTGDGDPAWSPDGSMIAFVSRRDGGQPLECSWSTVADFGEIGSVEAQIWMSHLIVAGEIVEEVAPAFGGSTDAGGNPGPTIYTDYILEVERQFRGNPLDTVRLRVEGGTVGDCVQTFDPRPNLSEGMRVLLFLGPEMPDAVLLPAYFASIVGDWIVSADDTLVSPGWAYNPEGVAGLSLDEVGELVTETLAGEPPADAYNPVPLEESPATPQ